MAHRSNATQAMPPACPKPIFLRPPPSFVCRATHTCFCVPCNTEATRERSARVAAERLRSEAEAALREARTALGRVREETFQVSGGV
eukprot:356262-Chlamydomonas_euryale.AAC.6